MTRLYANPYNFDAAGFYFNNADEYIEKSTNLTDRYGNHVEEFEIDFIDGDDAALFNASAINQANLSTWFDDIETLDDFEKINLYYLLNVAGYTLCQALDKVDEPNIRQSSLRDAAEDLFDECWLHNVPESIRYYIDYDKFARDCEIGGDLVEFEYNNQTYTCNNAAGI
jgi:Antirestriction protein (ArdA)